MQDNDGESSRAPLRLAPTDTPLQFNKKEFTLWDKIIIKGDITLSEFIKKIQDDYSVQVTMVSSGVSMLYAGWSPKKDRLAMK